MVEMAALGEFDFVDEFQGETVVSFFGGFVVELGKRVEVVDVFAVVFSVVDLEEGFGEDWGECVQIVGEVGEGSFCLFGEVSGNCPEHFEIVLYGIWMSVYIIEFLFEK